MANFSNFHLMEAETKDLVLDLMENADRQRSAFMSFVNIWMAFNGWMTAVTERETDADMIRTFAANSRLIDAYNALMVTSRPLHRLVSDFPVMWPVLNVRDVRKKLGSDAFWRLQHDDLTAACQAPNVRQPPRHRPRAIRRRGNSCCAPSTRFGAICFTVRNPRRTSETVSSSLNQIASFGCFSPRPDASLA
jgi:hypothetical protein